MGKDPRIGNFFHSHHFHHLLEIRPKLKTVSLLETMRATGLSRTYCGMIRRGVRVPHPRHWEALQCLVEWRNALEGSAMRSESDALQLEAKRWART